MALDHSPTTPAGSPHGATHEAVPDEDYPHPLGTAYVPTSGTPAEGGTRSPASRILRLLPGLGFAAVAVAVSYLISMVSPLVSPLLVAIVLGVVVGNVVPRIPSRLEAGLAYSGKTLLRAGIVALGAQVAFADILDLGWGILVLAACVVLTGVTSSILVGRLLKVDKELGLLIGCGFGICGAAAVAGVESTLQAKKENVAAAVGLVVAFGTAMIAFIPAASHLLGLSDTAAGIWAGASTHEVAQVAAIGGILGSSVLQVAIVTKLARVLMLAPTVAVLSLVLRRGESDHAGAGRTGSAKRPPLVPGFVLGFLAMVALRSFGWIPEGLLDPIALAQTILMSAAMFALGTGVRWRNLKDLGLRPILLAFCVTAAVTIVGLIGALVIA